MTDYSELVKALRCNGECHEECAYRSEEGWCDAEAKMDGDAADAIEELQQIADHYDQTAKDYWKEACEYKEQIPHWISVKERLPENNDAVNVVWVNRNPSSYYAYIKDKPFTATAHYYKGKWYWYSSICKACLDEYGRNEIDKVGKHIDILYWMPLPEPPTGTERSET